MSRFAPGLRRGAKVSQGQVIGYVGSTGWSTGAHLHYEFRVGGQAQDPNKFKSLAQQPLTQAELSRFRMAAAEMNHRFSLLSPSGGTTMAAR
jgi:murein DD-endopeptidase MepM/ murein hydrolase activator NlpD